MCLWESLRLYFMSKARVALKVHEQVRQWSGTNKSDSKFVLLLSVMDLQHRLARNYAS